MRFQTVGPPDAAHAGFADADRRRHRARTPVRCFAGLLARGHGHDAMRQARTDRGFASGPGRVLQHPATPGAIKRLRQRETFFGLATLRAAISLSCWPDAANNTMRARSTKRSGNDRLRAWDSNTVRCSGLNVMTGALRIRNRLLTS
jgi:hypothetical protein